MLCSKYGGAMRPTNVLWEDEFFDKVRQNSYPEDFKNNQTSGRTFKSEKRNATLNGVINQEFNHFANTVPKTAGDHDDDEHEQHYGFYEKMDENLNYKIENEHQIATKYAWAHLSCANFIIEIEYTPKSPLKVGKLNPERFSHPCIICCERNGAAIR